MNAQSVLLVAAFGALGSVARYLAATGLRQALGDALPFGTFAVNVLGSFLFGICWSLAANGWSPSARAAVFAGFFGGFTTFSSFAFEAYDLLQTGRIAALIAHVLGQNVLGVLGAWGGVALGRAWA